METKRMIPVDELAAYMNHGWPGEDWYLSDHAEFLWETTFVEGRYPELYRPRQPGALINLQDFEARVRWQGLGRDPTRGRGQELSALFQRWQRTHTDAVVVAYVPRDKLPAVTASLQAADCLVVSATDSTANTNAPRANQPVLIG